jgi:hypothetical protein
MLTPRVLLLIYDPVIESATAPTRLSRLLNWNDPDQLCAQYIADVAEASHGQVRYTIVARIVLDAYPVKADGFRYDDAGYLRAWRRRPASTSPTPPTTRRSCATPTSWPGWRPTRLTSCG